MIIAIILSFFLAIWLGTVIIPSIIRVSYKKRLFDKQDSRKKHTGLVPRLGGLAFVPVQISLFCFMAVMLEYFFPEEFRNELFKHHEASLLIFCGLILLFMIGVVDDLIGMDYKRKFIAQVFAASLLPIGGVWVNDLYGIATIVTLPASIGIPLTVFGTILIINAINLIDGLDGLCSGLVATGCITLGALFLANGAYVHALFAIVTAGILVPFFYYNVFGASKRRHRVFMGDTGSLTLGFTISFLAISFTMDNPEVKPFSEGAIVVAYSTIFIPVMDVATVMWTRFRNGKSVFTPDRNHIHHKMLRLGMSHRKAMVSILLIALFSGAMNIVLVKYISNNVVLLIDILWWILMNVAIQKAIDKRQNSLAKIRPETAR